METLDNVLKTYHLNLIHFTFRCCYILRRITVSINEFLVNNPNLKIDFFIMIKKIITNECNEKIVENKERNKKTEKMSNKFKRYNDINTKTGGCIKSTAQRK